MAAIPCVINGVIVDLYGRVITGPVKIMGEFMRSDVGVGGGPIYPPPGEGEKPPRPPTGIWPGPGDPDYPGRPPGNGKPPIDAGAHPSHPIALPGDPWWPPSTPPTLPPPGSPPVILPGTTPTHPINPPPAIVVDYPGVGKVLVPQPVPSSAPQQHVV